MRKSLIWITLAALVMACGDKKEEKKDSFEINRSKTAVKKETASEVVPVDLDNKGIGPIKEVKFSDEIDEELAAQGKATFEMICVACHQINQRMIGPAMAGVYERRSPEWVMNMILNPDGMLREDPIAQALLKEYNNMIMNNQNLSEDEARAIAEYLRTL
ncbi:MAG: cytochrome c [Eudoraea sp.]|nr:cytochrome c [Eudoraea sp.]MBT8322987.1 cytochrome c [Eudoraea sp.]NNJ38678.1 cytochrome c [Flavobacteriaceae bacterium]